VDEYQRVLVHPSVAARADGEHHPEKDPAPGPAAVSDVSDGAVGSASLLVQHPPVLMQLAVAPVWTAGCTTQICKAQVESICSASDLHGTCAHVLAACTGGAVRGRRAGGKLIVESSSLLSADCVHH
jgi:hypothetical protein